MAVSLIAAASHGRGPSADDGELTVEISETALVARERGGRERWRHDFTPAERVTLPDWHERSFSAFADGRRAVLAATSYSTDAGGTITGGRLFELTRPGRVERTLSFDDRLAFGPKTYDPPWAITDYRARGADGAQRIAVAAHHIHWWPSVVTLLNDRWERTGTFVNAGWIERLHWLSNDRLMAVGFSNARDGGMIAVLDPSRLNGQSPRTHRTEYACDSCGPESALRYVVLPRSEVNRATGAPFNRALLETAGDRLVIRTIEVPAQADPADALYEFSAMLDLRSASYGDRYWERHASLEAQGRLDHPRERCPERDGPPFIEVWERGSGWKTVPVRK